MRSRRALGSNRILTGAIVALILLVSAVLVVIRGHEFFVDAYEDIAYAFDPSAARAFQYGERHFSSSDPQDYDIDRAADFFNRAAAIDPATPYLYHELARTSFIEGNLRVALAQIDFQISMYGDKAPRSYYVRGLIEGYMGHYEDAELDYQHYLTLVPRSWAGMNDYAWVLLKDNKPQVAALVTDEGVSEYPDNPWLLNNNATALYETGDIADAKSIILRTEAVVQKLTPAQWSTAYPGNDPQIAAEGVETFQAAVVDNMHRIESATTSMSI